MWLFLKDVAKLDGDKAPHFDDERAELCGNLRKLCGSKKHFRFESFSIGITKLGRLPKKGSPAWKKSHEVSRHCDLCNDNQGGHRHVVVFVLNVVVEENHSAGWC
jgi:hypothetical protein